MCFAISWTIFSIVIFQINGILLNFKNCVQAVMHATVRISINCNNQIKGNHYFLLNSRIVKVTKFFQLVRLITIRIISLIWCKITLFS